MFRMWPKQAFIDKYNLDASCIFVKGYSSQIHVHKALKSYTQYDYSMTRTEQARRAVSHLGKFDNFVHERSERFEDQPTNYMLRSLLSYRFEFSVVFKTFPSPDTLVKFHEDLMVAVTHLDGLLSVRYLSYADLIEKQQTYYAIVSAGNWRWHTHTDRENGVKVTKLNRVSEDRMTLLRSTYGIADKTTCRNMKHLRTEIGVLMFGERYQREMAQWELMTLAERQHAYAKKQWTLTLAMCHNNRELFDDCRKLYHMFKAKSKFRWQPSHARGIVCQFIVYWTEPSQRTPAFDDAAELLLCCAKRWHARDHSRDLFSPGKAHRGIKPAPVINFEL